MYPPWNSDNQRIDPREPLYLWYQLATFHSSEECRAQKDAILQQMDATIAKLDPEKAAELKELRYQARCISSDEPRLSR